jgi:hypothetical protein
MFILPFITQLRYAQSHVQMTKLNDYLYGNKNIHFDVTIQIFYISFAHPLSTFLPPFSHPASGQQRCATLLSGPCIEGASNLCSCPIHLFNQLNSTMINAQKTIKKIWKRPMQCCILYNKKSISYGYHSLHFYFGYY